jgi:uncharacterized protein YbcV (DUF1398 family)
MKAAVFILLFMLASCSAVHAPTNQKAIIKTTFHCDHCKQCETCGQLFLSNMYKLAGVRMYEIDTDANTITVYYDGGKTQLDVIRNGIANLGYDADDNKATQAGYDKLDSCCKR